MCWAIMCGTPSTCSGPIARCSKATFPVDRTGMSYAVWWNAAKRMSASYNAAERALLFEGTARRVYRL